MLRDGIVCYKRRSSARKVEHGVFDGENGCQCIPQPQVSTWPVNREASQRARVSAVRRKEEVARIRVVVAKVPEVSLCLDEVRAKSASDALPRDACKLAFPETLHIDVEAHGLVEMTLSPPDYRRQRPALVKFLIAVYPPCRGHGDPGYRWQER